MEQLMWFAVIAAAMVFGWYLHQKYSGGANGSKGSAQGKGQATTTVARPRRKKRPRKRS